MSVSVSAPTEDVIERAIAKLIDVQHAIDIKTSQIGFQSNTVSTGTGAVVVRGKSNLTIEQTNDLLQKIELIYYYETIANMDLSDDELFVLDAVHNRFPEGFFTTDYIKNVLKLADDVELSLDYDKQMLIVKSLTGEVTNVPFAELAHELGIDFTENIKTYKEQFIQNNKNVKMKVDNAMSAVQSNRLILSNCSFMDSEVAFRQTNRAVQSIAEKLSAIANSDANTNASENPIANETKANETKANETKKETSEEPIEQKTSLTTTQIVIIVVAAILFTVLVLFIMFMPFFPSQPSVPITNAINP